MKPNLFICVLVAALQVVGAITASAAEQAMLATKSLAGIMSVSAGGNSFAPVFSHDGQKVAFISHAGNLVTNQTLRESLQVFVRDLVTSNIVLVSVSTNGRGGNANSAAPMLSSNGQFVVFASEASNLVLGDTNRAWDVFVRDLSSGNTRLVSVNLSGNPLMDDQINSVVPLSGNPLISADGQWVFFESRALNVTAAPDTNGTMDVFARHIPSNLTVVVSLDSSGGRTANGTSTLACVSADARYVGFLSTATDIAPGGTNAAGDLYRRDMGSGGSLCVSRNAGALLGQPYRCASASLSANGRYAAFGTVGASNVVFRHDCDSDSTTLIAVREVGAQSVPRISADGRYVTFDDGTNVFRFDANSGTNALVNVTVAGAQPLSGVARNPVATSDGNDIVFISNCPDLVTNSSTLFQVYARDMAAGVTQLISVATNGQPSATSSETSLLTVTPDFSLVGFDSPASDLVAGDGNAASDVFIRRNPTAEATELVSAREQQAYRSSGLAHASVVRDCISADGRFIAFTSFDCDLLPGDTNERPDLFIRDMLTSDIVTPGFSTNAVRSPAISANGRYVVYLRRAGVPLYQTDGGQIFRFDRETGTNEFVALSTSSVSPVISSNGNLVAFLSGANLLLRDMTQGTNLTLGPAFKLSNRDAVFTPDGRFALFLFWSGGATTLYARDTVLQQTGMVGAYPWALTPPLALAVSRNARFIAFAAFSEIYIVDLVSRTNQLIRSGTNARSLLALNGEGTVVVFSDDGRRLLALDRITREETVVAESGDLVNAPAVSADGRFVVYVRRTLGVNGPEKNVFTWQLFVRDRTLGTTTLITTGAEGANVNGPVSQFTLAADGRTVVFHSVASDLVPGDYNDKSDVFVLKLGGADTDGDGMDDDWEVAYFGNLLRNGSGDFDSDGQTDLQEFLAGTDPTNNGSIFRVLTVAPIGGGSKQVIWTGNPSRSYRVEYKDDLSGANWSALASAISWNGSTASATDSSPSGTRFYRVVRLP